MGLSRTRWLSPLPSQLGRPHREPRRAPHPSLPPLQQAELWGDRRAGAGSTPPQHHAHHHGLGAAQPPWAPTACSVSASWAQSRTMSWLAEKSLRVEKRYLGREGGAESSAPGVGGTQHPWLPLPTPDLLSQEKSPLAALTRSTTRARRAREGGRGAAPAGSPPSTKLWVPCASSCSLSVSVRKLVLASPASCGDTDEGTGGLQGASTSPPAPTGGAPNPLSTHPGVHPYPSSHRGSPAAPMGASTHQGTELLHGLQQQLLVPQAPHSQRLQRRSRQPQQVGPRQPPRLKGVPLHGAVQPCPRPY